MLWVVLILSLTLVFYHFYYKPASIISKYVKDFKRRGLKVKLIPYNPFSFFIIDLQVQDNQSGDGFRTLKTIFPRYDIVIGNVITSPVICFLSPQARKQFAKHEIDYTYEKLPFMVGLISRILGKGLIFSEGNQWKRKRRILSKFFTYEFIMNQVPNIVDICQKAFLEIEQNPQNKLNTQAIEIEGKQKYQFKLISLTNRIFSNVILSLFLGSESLKQTIENQRACNFIVKLAADNSVRIQDKAPFVLGPKFMDLGLTSVDRDINKRKQSLNLWTNQYIDNIICNKHYSKDNLISILHSEYLNGDKQQNYDRSELIDELKIFFFAGTDTTSHFTEMMIYYTAKNPQVYKRAQQQVDNFKESLSSTNNLKKLKYIEAIQKQTTRYYSPIPGSFPRITIKDHHFLGIQVYKGTSVSWQSIPTHYNQQYYENPHDFNPQRWISGKDFDGATLSGFGIGPRSCIGQSLALVESKIAFYLFLKRYEILKVPETLRMKVNLVYEAQNLEIIVKKRS